METTAIFIATKLSPRKTAAKSRDPSRPKEVVSLSLMVLGCGRVALPPAPGHWSYAPASTIRPGQHTRLLRTGALPKSIIFRSFRGEVVSDQC
jgi:hypothetical protein